jgi:hypothetical protein
LCCTDRYSDEIKNTAFLGKQRSCTSFDCKNNYIMYFTYVGAVKNIAIMIKRKQAFRKIVVSPTDQQT